MKRLIVDLFTEDDNRTWCIARVSSFIALISFIALGAVHVLTNHMFQPSEYGMGMGTLLGGAGVLIGGKAATQKDNVEKFDQ
jgi:F0F1-type ATP synthase assembly protein I